MEASECKCSKCGKQAVAFFPCVDHDIPSYPYCADCLYDAMIDMAEALWHDDKYRLAIAKTKAELTREKYKQAKK